MFRVNKRCADGFIILPFQRLSGMSNDMINSPRKFPWNGVSTHQRSFLFVFQQFKTMTLPLALQLNKL